MDEAQVRYELTELKKDFAEQISARDSDHEQQIQMLEQVQTILFNFKVFPFFQFYLIFFAK